MGITLLNTRLVGIRMYYMTWIYHGHLIIFIASLIFPVSISVRFQSHEVSYLLINMLFDFSSTPYI
jgi:hypothetical protein